MLRRGAPGLGLRAQLTTVGLFALLPYLALVAYTSLELKQEAHQSFEQDLQRFNSVFVEVNKDIGASTRNVLGHIRRAASDSHVHTNVALDDLNDILAQRPEFVAGGIDRSDATPLNGGLSRVYVSNLQGWETFHREVAAAKGAVVGKVVTNPSTGEQFIPIGISVENDLHLGTDVAYLLIGVQPLQREWGRLLSGFPAKTRYVVFNRHGEGFLGGSDTAQVVGPDAMTVFGHDPKPGMLLVTSRPDGVNRYWRFSDASTMGPFGSKMLVGVGVPRTAIDGTVTRVVWRNVVGLSTAVLIFLGIGLWLMERRALRPLRSVLETVSALGAGDFRARTNAGTYGGEVGRLVRSVDAAAALLQREEEERRLLFDSLAESEARYRTVMDASGDGIVLIDSQAKIVAGNRAFAKMVDVDSSDELYQVSFLDLIDGHDQELLFLEDDEGEITLPPSVVARVKLLTRRGERLPAELSVASTQSGDGRSAQSVIIARDIRERLRLEEEKRHLNEQLMHAQKMESVGHLAGGVAHDFNNLLTVIHGYISMGRKDVDNSAKVLSHLREIERAAKRAEDLTRQLLLFSRRAPITKTTIDLRGLIHGLAKMLRRLIGEDVQLTIEFDPAPLFIIGDTGSIEQAVVNLVVNARDAMSEGGRLNLRVKNRYLSHDQGTSPPGPPEGHYVVVEIEDNGHGMPPEVLENIFEPFFTTKARGKGTGLGLSVVFGVLQQHGGWIDVRSVPNEGTCFELFFPEAVVPEAPTAIDSGSEPLLRVRTGVILCVEDDDSIRHLVAKSLSAYGYRVLIARNRREADEIIVDGIGSLDLLLSDFLLPDGNGLDLVTNARKARPGLPVLLSTGYIDDETRIPDLERLQYPVLRKPFTIEQLLRVVGELLDYRNS